MKDVCTNVLEKALSVQGIECDCGMTFQTFQLAGAILDYVYVSIEIIYCEAHFPCEMLTS